MQRYSRQREVILNNLMSRRDHPTAEMVYTAVREELPKISLGTVYRNLSNLSEEKVILCFTIDGKDHFDGLAKPHVHLYCTECGSIADREMDQEGLRSFAKDFSEITNVIVHGKCTNCNK